jgi:hypothetical protein
VPNPAHGSREAVENDAAIAPLAIATPELGRVRVSRTRAGHPRGACAVPSRRRARARGNAEPRRHITFISGSERLNDEFQLSSLYPIRRALFGISGTTLLADCLRGRIGIDLLAPTLCESIETISRAPTVARAVSFSERFSPRDTLR